MLSEELAERRLSNSADRSYVMAMAQILDASVVADLTLRHMV
jgi:hypothetical protein